MPTITAEYKGDMLVQSRVGNHTFTLDVPADMGGKDRGPSPPEMFVSSIASCVAAVVAHYCNNSGLNAEGLSVSVSFEKLQGPTRLGQMRAVIRLPNCEPGKKAQSIIHVARRCPVYATILDTTSEMDITLET